VFGRLIVVGHPRDDDQPSRRDQAAIDGAEERVLIQVRQEIEMRRVLTRPLSTCSVEDHVTRAAEKPVCGFMGVKRDADVVQVLHALIAAGRLAGRLHRRRNQGDQEPNDCH
jgi:hypothetical protein